MAKNRQRSCLEALDFFKFYPQRLTLQDALLIRAIKPDYHHGTTNPQLVFTLMLEKLMMSNYNFRKVFLYELAGKDDEDEDEDDNISTKYQIAIHPMDALIALLLCANDFLRQDLYTKLTSCQVAVPLLLPDPVTNTIIFPLWAMHSIMKQWKCRKEGSIVEYEYQIVDCSLPLVSFIRFSQPTNFSKSKILNTVASDSKHDIFLDNESEGSSVNRHLVDGLVEVSWYFPSGKESDLFNNVITFANLRGNASDQRQQLDFLIAHSDMAFVFLQESDIHSKQEYLKMFASTKFKGKVTFLLDSWSDNSKQQLKSLVPHYAFISFVRKELAEIVKTIREKITNRMSKTSKLHLCQLSALLTKEYGIQIDKESEACQRGRALAANIMIEIQDIPLAEAKEAIVPLQGPRFWQKWATVNKKQNLMKLEDSESLGIENFFSKKRQEKDNIRKQQQAKAKQLSPVIEVFMRILVNEPDIITSYFLQWLKFMMDDRSRKLLPDLQKECQTTREKLRNADPSNQEQLKELLQKQSEKLIRASFGVEHLLREIGQIYESTIEMTHGQPRDVKNLPKIAAKLLISGMPLEIVDGDASHIPLVWVTAVFNELTKLLNNPRIFVLSVLGIQSTGKSTLLNTLFGVHFAVSAGRCTRGAYFQLLKLDPELSRETYMLVIDTEGLRAPEFNLQDSQQHDNELATLVIGLAGVTIINIFGEVPADISDILQTTVHAFIRMKELKIKPHFQFVRHHVVDIASKTKEGNDKLMDELDKMASLASKAEYCEDQYGRFDKVVVFDHKADVHNFPNLWKGYPPMAPVDPSYSEACFELKTKLVSFCESSSTLEQFVKRMSMLWDAVLKENFVFSFRNTLEMNAYSTLTEEFNKWSMMLKQVVYDWCLTLKSLSSSREEIEPNIVHSMGDDLDHMHEEISKVIEKMFVDPESSLPHLSIKWKADFELKLQMLRDNLKDKAQRMYDDIAQCKSKKITKDFLMNDILTSLRERLLIHDSLILSKLQQCPLEKREHFNDTSWLNIEKHLYILNHGQHYEFARDVTADLQLSVVKYLESNDERTYSNLHISEIIDMLLKAINEFDKMQTEFKFTLEYRIDFILEAAGYVLKTFNNTDM